MPIDPISLGLTAVGALTSLFGDSKEADAAEDQRRAETRAAQAQHQNTAEQNKIYKLKADAAYSSSLKQQSIYKEFAKDYNVASKQVEKQINELIQKETEAQNRASDAIAQRNETEIQQGRLNTIRDRRANIRATLATQSAIIAGAANKGATGGSGFAAGKADAGTQLARANLGIGQNLGIMDQIDAANKLYAVALTEANEFEAAKITEQNAWEFDSTRRELALESDLFEAKVAGMKEDTKLTKDLYDLQTKSAGITSTRNIQVAGAKDKALEGQTISRIGANISNYGSQFAQELDLFT